MEPLIQDVMNLNLKKIAELADGTNPIPLDKMVNYFTSDVVGQLAIGGKIGFLEQGKDVGGIIQSIHDGFYFMGNMGILPLQMLWINNPVSKWITKTFGGDRLNAFDVFIDWLDERVEERMTGGPLHGQPRDLLQYFIETKNHQGQQLSKKEVMIEGVNILAAGSDTTAISISACLGFLLTNLECKRRLMEEIDNCYQTLKIGEAGREVSFKEVVKLPYLSAVILESTRLHPSIQYQLPRDVPVGGIQMGEYFLPQGTTCGVSARAVNCSRDLFGFDAEEFRPERWIPRDFKDEERIRSQKSLLMTFFRHYDAEILNQTNPWKVKSQWFSFQQEFFVAIRRRDHS
ncbi:hypothetical protein FGRMN_5538 [Fusarium graminum]|nr:hypothetical protein FGRMN_5538 [Fusarium graminum]